MKNLFLAIFALLMIVSCSDDDDTVTNNSGGTGDSVAVSLPNVLVNEVVSKGSVLENEYGNTEDWVEIYNPDSVQVTLPANRIYFSDDMSDPTKFLLTSDITIAPKSYLVVFCDDSNTVANQIHTNFKLTSTGESFVISYKQNTGTKVIDQMDFPAMDGTNSYGRIIDGNDSLGLLIPTPGAANKQ